MKKSVALAFGFFAIAMLIMVGWGFIEKQSKESNTAPVQAEVPSSSSSSSSSGTAQQNSSPTNSSSSSYTKGQLATHNKPADCWMAINGGIYDVTNYVDMHPGGADIVLMYCGKDATQAYNTQGGRGRGHSSRADALLAQYKVGTLQ
jgi:cytochrome b involved in lipid metabolism